MYAARDGFPRSTNRTRNTARADHPDCAIPEYAGVYWRRKDRKRSFVTRPRQRLVALGIHPIVIRKVGSVADLTNPVLMSLIPLDRPGQTLAEADLGRPAPIATNLRTIDSVTAVVTGPILNVLNEGVRFAQQPQNLPHHVDVCHFIAAADVVNLSGTALFQRHQHRARMLVGEDPLTHVPAITVYRQRFVF